MALNNESSASRVDEEVAASAASLEALRRAMDAMQGHASFAFLGDITYQAQINFGYDGTLDEALALLKSLPDVQIEPASDPGQHRVHW